MYTVIITNIWQNYLLQHKCIKRDTFSVKTSDLDINYWIILTIHSYLEWYKWKHIKVIINSKQETTWAVHVVRLETKITATRNKFAM